MEQSAAYRNQERSTLLDLKEEVIGGRFLLLDRITCGSYSEIHLAQNLSPINDEPETVIVKILNLGLQGELDAAMERTLLENMELEALTLSRFRHANIVRLYNCGTGLTECTGRHFYYLVLEYMAGGDLFRFCRARPLSIEQTLVYAGQICEALSYAHSHNTVHRDVKPNNVLLSADMRRVKLLDFGTARLLDHENGLITRVGTAVYSAPEHYSLHQTAVAVTPAADVYSLAKTILFLMTGESPARIAQQPIVSLPTQLKLMPWGESLLYVLHKATRNRPDDRYDTARDFYKDLRDVTELTVVGPRRIVPAQPRAERSPNHTRIEVPVSSPAPKTFGQFAVTGIRELTEAARKVFTTVYGIFVACREVSRQVNSQAIRLGIFLRTLIRPLRRQRIAARLLMVIVITGVLLVASPYLINWWRALPSQATDAQAINASTTGKATTSTDVNIRSGPSGHEPKIGIAERSSLVRIRACNFDNTWCEIEVLQHGRVKTNSDSVDRGWVNKKYLILE